LEKFSNGLVNLRRRDEKTGGGEERWVAKVVPSKEKDKATGRPHPPLLKVLRLKSFAMFELTVYQQLLFVRVGNFYTCYEKVS
jgi:hypothetical protein